MVMPRTIIMSLRKEMMPSTGTTILARNTAIIPAATIPATKRFLSIHMKRSKHKNLFFQKSFLIKLVNR